MWYSIPKKVLIFIYLDGNSRVKKIIKECLREVLKEERLLLCQSLAPYISAEEQTEIEDELGSPIDYSTEELIDMTYWVKYGGSVQDKKLQK